jgi:hypothetical protein
LSHDEPNLQVIPAGSWRITNYALQPATDGAVSWVRCSVEGRAGAVVRLTPADPGAEATVWTAEAGSRPEWGPYFCELGPVKPVEMVPHVLLLGKLMTHKGNFLALTRYVARFGAVVTFEPEEAARAEHVILVGAAPLVSEEVEQQLQAAGARVERAQGDIAAVLDGAVAAGSPFLA